MKKICIVICYFGRWPPWFNIFLKTCEKNPTVNWLIYTDCKIPKEPPKNIRFIKRTLKNFNKLASEKLKLKVNIKRIHKICDIRPAYGIIFEDYLRKYDFWAYGDLDVIYGNIRKFLTPKVLSNYDVISTRKEYLTGHLTLIKNSKTMNNLYKKSKDYKKVFQSKKNYRFDECSNSRLINNKFNKEAKIESITHVVNKLEKNNSIKPLLRYMIKEGFKGKGELEENWLLKYKDNKLIDLRSKRELLYFHLLKLKYDKRFLIPDLGKLSNEFYINKDGFKRKTAILKSTSKYKKDRISKEIDIFLGKIGILIKKINPKLYEKIKR